MTAGRHLDPVLLAISDCLVLTALERAASRVLPRSVRSTGPRHAAHEQCAVHPDRLDKALEGAWSLLPLLADRYDVEVTVAAWRELLDSYCRALLQMGQPHRTTALAHHLQAVAAEHPAVREFVAVG
jgi:hypothetical protein